MITFSIVTPVFDPEPDVLTATIESVLSQTYGHWQLLLIDDASTDPRVSEVLRRYADLDDRILVVRRAANGGISAASNDGLAQATGEFVGLLDHDDELDPEALSCIYHVLTETDPEADIVYTDEDKVDSEGRYYDTFHKPDWSPEYLEGCMYLGHFVLYRRSLMESLGGFRSDFDGSQDWDLALRATEVSSRVQHVPRVLYHWRAVPQSVASNVAAKPWATNSGRAALEERLRREGLPGRVEETGVPGWFRVRRNLPYDPLVSVILPTAGVRRIIRGEEIELVLNCVKAFVDRTDYENFEIVCVLNGTPEPGLEARLVELAGERVRCVPLSGAFNFSTAVNVGVLASRGEVLLLLNDDVEVRDKKWLRLMLEMVQLRAVGAVGAKLLLEDGTVQHAGVIHSPEGTPHHPHAGQPDGTGYFGDLLLNMNYLAVTGACLMVRRQVFEELGGFSPGFPLNYNDIDFCLKAVSKGYRNVQVNGACLFHYESSTRTRSVTYQEVHDFLLQWRPRTLQDGFATPTSLVRANRSVAQPAVRPSPLALSAPST